MRRYYPCLAVSFLVLILLVLVPWGAVASEKQELASLGVTYRLIEQQKPRPNRIHVLRIDRRDKKVDLRVIVADDPDGSGPAEAALVSPLKLAGSQKEVVALLNTNPWQALPTPKGEKPTPSGWYEGRPVDILGLAVSNGTIRSAAEPGYVSIWLTREGKLAMGTNPPKEGIQEGLAGFQQVVRAGKCLDVSSKDLHPRTALGVDKDGQIVWWVVVDGRQPGYSEGMSQAELAELLRELGCWDAANLDGGGSSLMAKVNKPGDELQVVNSPSDRLLGKIPRLRPLPTILTLVRTPTK